MEREQLINELESYENERENLLIMFEGGNFETNKERKSAVARFNFVERKIKEVEDKLKN